MEMNSVNVQNDRGGQKERADGIKERQSILYDDGMSEVDATGKSEYAEAKELKPVDRADWIVSRISELGGYENVNDSVKADIFGFDIVDVSGSIKLFSDVMKKLGIRLDGDELYEEFQRIYDESISRNANDGRVEYKMWNRGRGK